MSKPFIINGEEIKLGEEKRLTANVAKLPSHAKIDISITVSRGVEDGPVLLLLGGLHGDEINGVETVRRMIEKGWNKPDRGTVVSIPILNVFGFIFFSRSLPDGKDVNRSFPGNKNGSLASRLAHYLTNNILPIIDYGVDFHTGGAQRTNYPQIRCSFQDEKSVEMAKAFHAPFTLNSPYRPRSLRQTAMKMGKKIIVFEGGESSRFDEMAITHGMEGAMRLMHSLGMIDDYKKPFSDNVIIRNSSWVRAKKSGIFNPQVVSGQSVLKNQVVGYITDTFGEFSKVVKSPARGFIVGLNNNPIVYQGDALMHIGVTKGEIEQ